MKPFDFGRRALLSMIPAALLGRGGIDLPLSPAKVSEAPNKQDMMVGSFIFGKEFGESKSLTVGDSFKVHQLIGYDCMQNQNIGPLLVLKNGVPINYLRE